MKHINESIIGRKGVSSGKTTGLWQIDELVPISLNKKGKICDILTHITRQNNRGASCDIYIDPLSDLLKIKSNIAGFRSKAEAMEHALAYINLNPSGCLSGFRFIGITKPYGMDEPEPLDWDYILGIDNNCMLFILHKN